jgi:hypothetical protein
MYAREDVSGSQTGPRLKCGEYFQGRFRDRASAVANNTLESGIAATLPPGAYTVLLAGLNNGTGIGLVEIYDRGGP